MKGKLYLVPNLISSSGVPMSIPEDVKSIACRLRYFICENERETRRYLKKLDRNFPIDDAEFYGMGKHSDNINYQSYLKSILDGNDMGVISDAGCPAVADPGYEIVRLAHQLQIEVAPLVGPSSILLALMASGLNGQKFTFHGYLPHDKKHRQSIFANMRKDIMSLRATQIMMDAPYRNNQLIKEIVESFDSSYVLSVSCNINEEDYCTVSQSISQWKKSKYDYHKKPAMICLGKA